MLNRNQALHRGRKTKKLKHFMKKELRLLAGLCLVSFSHLWAFDNSQVGKEVSIPAHLKDGEELQIHFLICWPLAVNSFKRGGRPRKVRVVLSQRGRAIPLSDPYGQDIRTP